MSLSRIAAAIAVLGLAGAAQATTITIVNADDPGEGFNDPTVINENDGFPAGTTLGAKRLAVFQAAANVWAGKLTSNIEIKVLANFDPLTPCTSQSAVLGAAGPSTYVTFAGAPHANTFYPIALAEAISNSNRNGTSEEIDARFNSSIDTGCFGNIRWWYATSTANPNPGNHVSLFPVVLHELGHGLGFISIVCTSVIQGVCPAVGAYQQNIFDVWSFNQQDRVSGLFWNQMSNAQRAASMTSDPNLVWNGTNVNAALPTFAPTGAGETNGFLRLYAPATFEPGSSVSHWTTAAANPDLLMEPVLSNGLFNNTDITPCLFKDIGWTITGSCGGAGSPNTAPSITAPVSIAMTEDVAGNVSGVTFADADAGSGSLTATFSVGSGSLSTPTCTGVTAGGTATSRTLAGTLSNLNACLAANNLKFTTAANDTTGTTLAITINDNGNTGTGGALSANRSVTLTVTAVNDAPTLTLPTNFGGVEDQTMALAFNATTVTDVDGAAGAELVTLAVATGTLSATSGGGVTVGGTPTALTLTGTVANLNTFLAAGKVSYLPASNVNGSIGLTVTVNDQGSTGSGGAQSASATRSIDIGPVNDAPSLTAPASLSASEDAMSPLAFGATTVVDVDGGSGTELLTLAVPTGTLSATSGNGVTVGGSATTMSLSGTVANLNAFLAASRVSYLAVANSSGSVTLTLTINDQGNTGSGTALSASTSLPINVTAINDPPSVSLPATGFNVSILFPTALAGISVADVDAGGGSLQLTLNVSSGTLTGSSAGGVTVAGSGTASLTLTGTLVALNDYLANSPPNFVPGSSTTLLAVISDQGNTGTGGPQTTNASAPVNAVTLFADGFE